MKTLRVWQLAMLIAALMVAGCGQSSSESSEIDFWSPAVEADGVISPRVSCGAGTLWLPLKWGSVPSETEELAVFIGRFKEGDGAERLRTMPFGALVSGIDPGVRGIAANTFPPDVIPASFGPVSCPLARRGQRIHLELFALDHMRPAVSSASLSPDLVIRLANEALAVGRFTASY